VPRFVGKYEVLRALATGGMAEIFVARAHGIEGFQKAAVIKRLRPEIASDQQFLKMFLDEARVLATLHHSNIVQIYDVGAVDGSYYFAMELLRGQDVHHLVARARRSGSTLPLEHSLFIIMSTLAGLHYAHEKRDAEGRPLDIVHRDVSPSNVFVTYEGDVKVIDFGIAKTAVQSTQTRMGVVKGKIRYMSPEQCAGGAGGPLDRRSDVFAASIMLWEMTLGRRLFSGTDYQMLRQIVETDAPSPSVFVPDYPPELERIVMKGLHRDPELRYATAQQMQEDLDAFVRERRLAASSLSLGRYMRERFPDAIEAWAAADRSDQAFPSHVRDLIGSPVSEPSGGTPRSGSNQPSAESSSGTPRSSADQVSAGAPQSTASPSFAGAPGSSASQPSASQVSADATPSAPSAPAAVVAGEPAAPPSRGRASRVVAAAVFVVAASAMFWVLRSSEHGAPGAQGAVPPAASAPAAVAASPATVAPPASASAPASAGTALPAPTASAAPPPPSGAASAAPPGAPSVSAPWPARQPSSSGKKASVPGTSPTAAPAKPSSWDSDSPMLPP